MWKLKTRKTKPVLIGIFYQPRSNNQDKLAWIDKIETVLAIITISFDGAIT